MIRGEKIGVGVVTCERPALFRRAVESVDRWLSGVADVFVWHQDGPELYGWTPGRPWEGFRSPRHHNVARGKNLLLLDMLAQGCDHLFLLEDDTEILDPQAVVGYIRAARENGVHYLSAHPHGEAETTCAGQDGLVTYWTHVGAMWTYMTRHGLETAGPYDDRFGNHHGDIELPQRWARAGLCTGWGRLPDATGSERWVQPRCLTRDQSLIGSRAGWAEENAAMLAWWAAEMPETVPTEMRPATEGRAGMQCLPANP